MSTPEFKPLAFEKVDIHTKIRPRIFISDDPGRIRGELVSFHHAKNALLFTMNFYPSWADFDAEREGRLNELVGWATLLIVKKGTDYFGRMVEGEGIDHGYSGKFSHIGSTESYPGHPGRGSALFLLKGWGKRATDDISVSVYLRTRLSGGWKDIVIREPHGMMCIARP